MARKKYKKSKTKKYKKNYMPKTGQKAVKKTQSDSGRGTHVGAESNLY